jgi:hypothetical protein
MSGFDRTQRAADFLAQGATVEIRDLDIVWLKVGGQIVMHTTKKTVREAKKLLAETGVSHAP